MDTHTHDSSSRQCTALVTGAHGFLAGFIIAALRARGWRVIRGVRLQPTAADERHCDFAQAQSSTDWRVLLDGVDAVVNVAGILRETRTQSFEAIHHTGPLALARACVEHGVRDFVQISALGDPADGEFIASKHRFDAALLGLELRALVLRPSIVYTTRGSYGGTSLLRALSALPVVVPLPGAGHWPVQPLAAEDLGELVAAALDGQERGMFEVGCERPMALREYLLRWRGWLRIPGARTRPTPLWAVDAAVAVGERFGIGPMGQTMWRMLKRGNVCAPDAHVRVLEAFGTAPRDLDSVLAQTPSQVQDRWQAQLYLLAPLLRWTVILLCLISAWAGFATPAAEIEALSAGSLLAHLQPVALARVAGGVDLVLALWLASGWRARAAVASTLLLVLGYTAVFGALVPALWLDPLGGLAKNLVLLPALAVLWVLSDRR
ncbi:SDR family oxidoreductase [Aquimonas voraii]|uniref:SDR family oxidoreductase n=1 Tax=Aquimonas voraii TaxID=265719 RepID=UPI000B87BFD4|nr:SDR family oxidoreductase [Aquimonas voraii]